MAVEGLMGVRVAVSGDSGTGTQTERPGRQLRDGAGCAAGLG